MRQCLLTRGLIPVLVSSKSDDSDPAAAAKRCVNEAIAFARGRGLVEPGQLIGAAAEAGGGWLGGGKAPCAPSQQQSHGRRPPHARARSPPPGRSDHVQR